MNVPDIPNNSLTKELKELVELCRKLYPEYGENLCRFAPPATEQEIAAWEQKNGINIPEKYKDWLRFSNGSIIRPIGNAEFYSLERLVIGINIEGIVNNDLIIIGNAIGNGTFILFSRTSGKFYSEDHGELREFENFNQILNFLMDIT